MFERFTEPARRALFFARAEAARMQCAAIDSDHLLLGLAREAHGPTAAILAHAGLSLDGLRAAVGAPSGEAAGTPAPDAAGHVSLTEGGRAALLRAGDEAEELGHDGIGPEHLLLGILDAPSPATAMLTAHGVTAASIRARLA